MATMRELIKAVLNKDITQRDLAGKIGFSHSTIQKILFTETKHTYEIRKKVADYFGVPVSDFYEGEPGATGQRTDIALRDIAAARDQQSSPRKIKEQSSTYNFNKYKVVTEVGEILDSGNTDIITALVRNVQEFKRAVETAARLDVCEEELKVQRKEIDDLHKQVDKLTTPPTTVKPLVVLSANGET